MPSGAPFGLHDGSCHHGPLLGHDDAREQARSSGGSAEGRQRAGTNTSPAHSGRSMDG